MNIEIAKHNNTRKEEQIDEQSKGNAH